MFSITTLIFCTTLTNRKVALYIYFFKWGRVGLDKIQRSLPTPMILYEYEIPLNINFHTIRVTNLNKTRKKTSKQKENKYPQLWKSARNKIN